LTRTAAVLLWINGLGFGICLPPRHLEPRARLRYPDDLRFPRVRPGPFERIGIKTTVPLLIAFLFVCSLEVAAGWLLWGGSKAGAILALAAALPLGGIFWWGFELPIPPILAVARTVLIVLSWRNLE
jgi:hypothetical protein